MGNLHRDSPLIRAFPKYMIDSIHSPHDIGKASRDSIKQEYPGKPSNQLPNLIVFPYARHSSLPELRYLVKTLKPKDVWPCTFDFPGWERRGITIRNLFGDYCSGNIFAHDGLMERMFDSQINNDTALNELNETQNTVSSRPIVSSPTRLSTNSPELGQSAGSEMTHKTSSVSTRNAERSCLRVSKAIVKERVGHSALLRKQTKRTYEEFCENEADILYLQEDSQASALSADDYETRLQAFKTAQRIMNGDGRGTIGLISTTDHHTIPEEELGGG